MSYVALYRKYRSQAFDQVVGQQHVTTVLQNAIRMGRIAHAYLFCGPRGCGKTSTARLLARALNCQGPDGAATAPQPQPCGVCDLCRRIRDGAAMDVIEMDAASETGIDDVREKIIENAKYAPGEARCKVYIIDEVHDLSLKAFDSLLKTIEEPPAHVVFILATTEPHKVPITVRSRCQRMDFRRGTLADLADNLRRVLDAEGIGYEGEAILAVARAAEGSFRDSLSLLEQALAYTDGERLTTDAVHASIGTVGTELLDQVVMTLAADDMHGAFLRAAEVVDSGKDVKQALSALQGQLRDLLVATIADSPAALADVSAERFGVLKERAALFTPAQLLAMIDVLAAAERDLRFTNQHHRLFETALWKALPRNLGNLGNLGILMSRDAEQAVSGPAVAQPAAPRKAVEPVAAAPRDAQPQPGRQPASGSEPPGRNGSDAAQPAEPPPAPDARHRAAVPPAGADIAKPDFAQAVDLDVLRRAWPRIRTRVVERSKSAQAFFGSESVIDLDGKFVVLGFPNEFTLSRVDKPKGRELLEQVIAAELGIQGLKVRCVLGGAVSGSGELPAASVPGPLDLGIAAVADDARSPGDPEGAAAPVGAVADGALNGAAEESAPPDQRDEEDFLQVVVEEFSGTVLDD